MEYAYYLLVILAILIGLTDFRKGLFLCLLIDVVRDPVRKLVADQPVAITVAGAVPWAAVFIGAWDQHRREIGEVVRRYPVIQQALTALAWAILPAAALSVFLYTRGWLLAAIGMVSYVVPLLGIGVGIAAARETRFLVRLLGFYCVVNSIALVGTLFEFLDWSVPALGGIQVEWVRYRSGYTVDLITGFYRSPDIMGLHAAHVVVFAVLLAIHRPRFRHGWLAVAMWAGFGLLLCGRRKMIVIPLAFGGAFVWLAYWRGLYASLLNTIGLIGVLAAAVVGGLLWSAPAQGHEYTDYAVTIFTESRERVERFIMGSAIGTLQQVGILGAGLGTATQGRYYVRVKTGRVARGWQEDGVSRAFLELGVPGVLLVFLAAVFFLQAIRRALLALPRNHAALLLQLGLASIVAADFISYLIAHQHFSGDPGSAILVTLFAGSVLALGARPFRRATRASVSRRPVEIVA